MAEENKPQQEVDIDTDGVNEEIINVDKPAEPDEAFSKKEDVDLGYTNPIKDTKVEAAPAYKVPDTESKDVGVVAIFNQSVPLE